MLIMSIWLICFICGFISCFTCGFIRFGYHKKPKNKIIKIMTDEEIENHVENYMLKMKKWDVSKVKNMSWMFGNSQFTGDIDNWDVSKYMAWAEAGTFGPKRSKS